MRPPPLRAVVQRRLLVNYRVDPDVLAAALPPPFRPLTVAGFGVAGLCLLRLGAVRPPGVPAGLGLTAENVAHRVAVRWADAGGTATGVYIPRRDSSSRLATLLGGRVFPGWQRHARFDVREGDGRYDIDVDSDDGAVRIRVRGRSARVVPPGSVFPAVAAASAFYRGAPVGYAATPRAGVFDGVELATDGWSLTPVEVAEVTASWFDDPARFPAGTIALDSAFVMAGLASTWRPQPPLGATAAPVG